MFYIFRGVRLASINDAYKLESGYVWENDRNGVTLTYKFYAGHQSYWDYLPSFSYHTSNAPFSAQQESAVRSIFSLISSYTNITFTEVTGATVPNLGFINAYSSNITLAGSAYLPQGPAGGDVFINRSYWNYSATPKSGDDNYYTLMHEIGHALGLQHSFDELNGTYATEKYSVMAYDDSPWGDINASTFMLYDIAALQHLYGSNTSYNTGDDTYYVSATSAKSIWDAGGIDTINGSSYRDGMTIDLNGGTFSSIELDDNLAIAYNVVIENFIGGDGDDRVTENSADNSIIVKGGDDYIYGSAGQDYVDGGAGEDTLRYSVNISNFIFSAFGNVLQIASSAFGVDLITSVENFRFSNTTRSWSELVALARANPDPAHVGWAPETINVTMTSGTYQLKLGIKNALLLGTANVNLTGDEADNELTGNAGANIIDGGNGADLMAGGRGNDTYIVDDESDEVSETETGSAGGTDTVKSSIDFGLGANIENLTLMASAVTATGNALSNYILGNDANNFLDGLQGKDTLRGGDGDDIYVLDVIQYGSSYIFDDTAIEYANEGIDTIRLRNDGGITALTPARFSMPNYFENLDISASGGLLANLFGNNYNNIMTGNSADNLLDGASGSDTMMGGAGNDVYVFDVISDTATENTNQGSDTIHISYSNASKTDPILINLANASYASIENIEITGKGLFDVTGNADNNRLTGNASNNTLIGGNGHDILNGNGGIDILNGGSGDDIYIIDNIADVLIDTSGNDTVEIGISSGTYILQAGFENGILQSGSRATLTGNAAHNELTGNTGANILDGGAGADIMIGDRGNDTYIVDDEDDDVIETEAGSAGGNDTVKASVGFILGANIENLMLSGSAVEGTGNDLANSITGNNFNNLLDGNQGKDTLAGGLGDDTYIVDLILSRRSYIFEDKLTESANQGIDTLRLRDDGGLTVLTAINLTLSKYFENFNASASGNLLLNLYGSNDDNILTGNSASNILDGKGGSDTMIGGAGNDVYIFDVVSDTATESINQGNDTIIISYANASKTVPILINLGAVSYANIENVEIIGKGLFDITGNAGNNILTGNASDNVIVGGNGHDTLDGAAGNDTLNGGAGNDIYVIDRMADIIIDSSGNDTIRIGLSSGTYILQSGIENGILLTGSRASLTGNSANNALTGNTGANILDGGSGADTMTGDRGNDTYIVDNQNDVLVEAEAGTVGGTDIVKSSVNFILGTNIENLTLTENALEGTGNALANTIIGNDEDNLLDALGGKDYLRGGLGDDVYIVDLIQSGRSYALEDSIFESSNQGVDTIRLRNDGNLLPLTPISLSVANHIENFDISAAGALSINIAGNGLSNILTGNDGVNTLNGGAGNDALIGADGADTLYGGTGMDIFLYESGHDSFISSSDTIKDFTTGDKLAFVNASGLSFKNEGAFFDLINAVDEIKLDGTLDDHAVFFTIEKTGYIYVNGNGDGAGINYDGTIIALTNKITFSNTEIDFNGGNDQEMARFVAPPRPTSTPPYILESEDSLDAAIADFSENTMTRTMTKILPTENDNLYIFIEPSAVPDVTILASDNVFS